MQVLSDDTRDLVLSSTTVCSFSQCIEELFLNAIDAQASAIKIAVDFNQLNVTIVDNGEFIFLYFTCSLILLTFE